MFKRNSRLLFVSVLLVLPLLAFLFSGAVSATGSSMVDGIDSWQIENLFTVGETFTGTTGAYNTASAGDYTPPGILDGLGAYQLDHDTVRVLANHELQNNRGYDYEVSDGMGSTFALDGARISYFDIDKDTYTIVDAGLAYNVIYDANGDIATDNGFLPNDLAGFSRFCSAQLVEAGQFSGGRGLADRIYFTGEEDGGSSNPVGGAVWALDPATGSMWHVPDMGRGAWENLTEIDTGSYTHVAFILADDTSPFDADGDGENEAAPLYLYLGEKNPDGDFLARNGLRGGQLFVWVSNTYETSPLDFNTSGTLKGAWMEVDNSQNLALADEFGANGYDEFGYPTQRNLWTQAEELGAFGFSRPEDVSTHHRRGNLVVLSSTGVDTYAVDAATGNGADTFGTIYAINTHFSRREGPVAWVTILYDGDADPTRALRSPDNLEWADDGHIYIQEDKAETDTLTGELLFGLGAVNPNEAGIVKVNPYRGEITRIANIDRGVVLDPTTTGTPVDVDAGVVGAWESSGIVDVSSLFGTRAGTLFLFTVQAHGIEDQTNFNSDSRINDDDLVEGGQLSWLVETNKFNK